MGNDWEIKTGDARKKLKEMEPNSVQTCVTSPPYWGLRDYGVDGQIGLEESPDAFVRQIVEIFREVRRVLRDDGTVWLNLGDSYNAGRDGGHAGGEAQNDEHYPDRSGRNAPNLKPKDLCGIPWRVALALQKDGWWLRNDVIWAKSISGQVREGSCMPESVTDRLTTAHEHVFLLSPSKKYFYDHHAIKEPVKEEPLSRSKRGRDPDHKWEGETAGQSEHSICKEADEIGGTYESGRNRRDVWQVNPGRFSDAHFAVMPEELARPCILAGTSEKGECPTCGAPFERRVEKTGGRDWREDEMAEAGLPGEIHGEGGRKRGRSKEPLNDTKDVHTKGWSPTCDCQADEDPVPQTVLDPFAGAGTTGVVALRHGRDFVGIDLNDEYVEMAEKRIREDRREYLSPIHDEDYPEPEEEDEHSPEVLDIFSDSEG